MLSDSPRGPRLCVSLLDRISSLFEADDSSEEGRAFDLGCVHVNFTCTISCAHLVFHGGAKAYVEMHLYFRLVGTYTRICAEKFARACVTRHICI